MNHFLYIILNLGSLSVPLLYSIFEKKLHFIQYFKAAILSIFPVAAFFLVWDAWFTKMGVWGFNAEYYIGFKIAEMPIEEWMFFFCIPYSCLFTHEVLKFLWPKFKLSKAYTILISLASISIVGFLLASNFGKWYTTVNFILFIALMLYSLQYHLKTLQEYFPSFLIILIPFLIVNGVLTGSFIEEPVVWYNNNENIGFRIFTIPFEDIFYAFNLLFSIQLIFNFLKSKKLEQ